MLISSEALILSSIVVIGVTAGAAAMRDSVNDQFVDTANAIRAIDPSYSYPGQKIGSAWVAGGGYQRQAPQLATSPVKADGQTNQTSQAQTQTNQTQPRSNRRSQTP